MTLLDAKEYDPRRERRRRLQISTSIFVVLVIAFFAWNFRYWPEERIVDKFFDALQQKQYETAYGIWFHDPDWQQHKDKYGNYPFDRFQEDWSPTSSQNEYGVIKSHDIVAARMAGNVLLMGIRLNGAKSKALFLNYDPKSHQLGFSPVELYLGP